MCLKLGYLTCYIVLGIHNIVKYPLLHFRNIHHFTKRGYTKGEKGKKNWVCGKVKHISESRYLFDDINFNYNSFYDSFLK